ncbi:hypothetical protein D3C86_1591800 [compost metagenome]
MPSTTVNGFTRSRTGPMTCHLLGFIRPAHAGHYRPYLFTIQAMPLLFQVASIRLTEKPFFIIQKKMGTVLRRITVWTYLQHWKGSLAGSCSPAGLLGYITCITGKMPFQLILRMIPMTQPKPRLFALPCLASSHR